MHPVQQPQARDAQRSVVLTKAVLRSAERLGLSASTLGKVLGLSEATISRMKRGEARIEYGTKSFELAAALLHKAPDAQGSPFPGRIHPTASVIGMPDDKLARSRSNGFQKLS